jgi:hypothetical protein
MNPQISNFCVKNIPTYFKKQEIETTQFECLVYFISSFIKNPSDFSENFKNYNFLTSYNKASQKSMKKHLINLSEKEREFIKGTFIEKLYEKNLEHFQMIFDIVKNSALSNNNNQEKITKDEFIHAYNIVNNQKVEIKKNGVYYYVISPIIDLLNFSKEYLNTKFIDRIKEENKIILKASKDILKGEEIFVDYGEKDNIDLFNFFGVTIMNNKSPKVLSGAYGIKIKRGFFDFDLHSINTMQHIQDFIQEVLEKLKVLKEDEIIYLETEKNILYKLEQDFDIENKRKKVKEIDLILENNFKNSNELYFGLDLVTMKNIRTVLIEEIEILEINKDALKKLKRNNYGKMLKYKKNGKYDEVKNSKEIQKKKETLANYLHNNLFLTGNDEFDKLKEFDGEDFSNFKVEEEFEIYNFNDNDNNNYNDNQNEGEGFDGPEGGPEGSDEDQKIFDENQNQNENEGDEGDFNDKDIDGEDEDIYEEDENDDEDEVENENENEDGDENDDEDGDEDFSEDDNGDGDGDGDFDDEGVDEDNNNKDSNNDFGDKDDEIDLNDEFADDIEVNENTLISKGSEKNEKIGNKQNENADLNNNKYKDDL